jgi:hypothetical protein
MDLVHEPNLKDSVHISHVQKPLYVIAVVSNPRRFKRRYQLFKEFVQRMKKYKGIELYVAEMALGDREFEMTEEKNPNHIQLRGKDELWVKENLINIAVSKLPADWKYVSWIDADIQFINEHWVQETIHMLQHHDVVQLFETCADMGPTGRILKVHYGFGYMHQFRENLPKTLKYEFHHTGYAWACTRKLWNKMGGLMDWAILGAADHHMALAWTGKVMKSVHGQVSDSYKKHLQTFQDKCDFGKTSVGYVKGTIAHFYHGSKKNRKYQERWQILVDNKFDPDRDITYSADGLLWFSNLCNEKLRDQISEYFYTRDEDSIDEPEIF